MSGDKTAKDLKVGDIRRRLEKRGVNTRNMRHRRVLEKKLQALIDADRAAIQKDLEAANFKRANAKSIFGEGEGISDAMTKRWAADRAKTRGRERGLGSRIARTAGRSKTESTPGIRRKAAFESGSPIQFLL